MGIGAAIGAVGAIGGALITSSGNKKAANIAAGAATQNNALQGQIYQSNTANLSPFMQRGNAAGNQINALLGLGGSPGTAATYGPASSGYGPSGGFDNNGDFGGGGGMDPRFGGGIGGLLNHAYNTQYGGQHFNDPGQMGQAGTPAVSAQDAANNAFTQFHNSDGYQFRLGQGLNAVNTNHALRGSFESGAAAKELNNYAQGQASNEFGNYVGMLQNQQGVGLSGANALAGVGTNYGRDVSSNNNNAAQVAGNAAMSSGNAFGNAFSNIAGGVAGVVGQTSSSSYPGGGSAFARQYGTGGTAYGSGGY